MSNSLVPYQKGILIPADWKAVGLAVSIPGALDGYHGPAAVVLTDNALHLCGPNGANRTVTYMDIRQVSICDLRGIAVEVFTHLGSVKSNPRDTFGIEITYEPPGWLQRHLRILVYFYNNAAEWVSAIEDAIALYHHHSLGIQKPPFIRRDQA